MSDLDKIIVLNQHLCEKEHKMFDKTTNMNYSLTEFGKNYFIERINSGNAFVALDNGEVIGYLIGSLVPPEPYRTVSKFAELENMIVLEKYRSKGVGKKLIDKFVEWCMSHKLNRIKVYASAQNLKAINFYKREGFNEYSIILEKEI